MLNQLNPFDVDNSHHRALLSRFHVFTFFLTDEYIYKDPNEGFMKVRNETADYIVYITQRDEEYIKTPENWLCTLQNQAPLAIGYQNGSRYLNDLRASMKTVIENPFKDDESDDERKEIVSIYNKIEEID